MRGLILSSGYGKRLRPLTYFKPKPMVKVFGRPIISYIYDYLRSYGIREIIINTHYKPQSLYKHFKDSALFFYESKPSGEAGAIKKLIKIMPSVKDEYLLVCNGDTITDLNLNDMFSLAKAGSIKAMDNKTYAGYKILSPDYLRGIDKTVSNYYGDFWWQDLGTFKGLKKFYEKESGNMS